MKKLLFFLLIFFSFLSGQLNAQCISGDCQNGEGAYLFPSGAKYVGLFKNGEVHGKGVCYYTDGSKYSGEWVHRYPEGKGTKILADGQRLEGNWRRGRLIDAFGRPMEMNLQAKGGGDLTNIQVGCISGNCNSGQGIFAYADGSKYQGQFAQGQLHGWGTWFYNNGDKYIGSFKNNFSHGKGTIYHIDGTQTSGHWYNGEYMGDGRALLGEEGCISGNCENGNGTYVYKGGVAKYIGVFLSGLPEGRGVCEYANGDRYEGEWKAGKFNGQGTLFKRDNTQVSGRWMDGIYMGKAAPAVPKPLAPKPVQQDGTSITQFGQTKVWAVVIGVAAYKGMPALRYTDDDAYRIYAFLKSPEGGALKDEQISIMVDEAATRANILREMEKTFSKAGPNDLVILYFSGHGLKGSFLPIDFDGFNNKLFHEEINAILDSSPARYKLCIADACHSGSLLQMRGTANQALSKYYETLAQARPGTALIMSSKSDETSLESSGLRQGVFSHFLIRGLKGEGDENGDQVIVVSELFNYIHKNVTSYTGLRQSPVIKGDYDAHMTVSVVR